MTLYRSYAEELAQLIETGALKSGERLPSLREASRRRNISISTVMKAYHWLEARGLVVANVRSGFTVSTRLSSYPELPVSSRPRARATTVDKSALIFDILASAKSREVVPLGSAFPSPRLFPLQRLYRSLNRSMRHLDPQHTVTDLSPGNAELRRQIALRYHLDGIRIAPEELVITDGAMEALNLCLQAVTRPGNSVVIESPTFYASLQALERLGLRAIEVATHPTDGIDLDALATVLTRHSPAACWVMTNFQNPLGARMPEFKKRQLVDLLARHDVALIEDDVYGELYYGDRRPKPAKAFDKTGHVLHCSSFSKCLAPGYRIGWAAAGRYQETVERLKLSSTLSAALPSQLALADYLQDAAYGTHLSQLRQQLYLQRDRLIDGIQTHFPEGTKLTRPQGGYFLWVEMPKGTDSLELYQQALQENISIAPGALFSARDDFAHCIRVNYGHPDHPGVDEAIARLGKLTAQCRH